MEKLMQEVIVRTMDNGLIKISRDYHDGAGERFILITLEQADVIIKWLQQISSELTGRGPLHR